jgi:hypothetical protein
MDTQHEKHCKSTTLYDMGCGFTTAMLFSGVVSGVVASRWQKIGITRKRGFVYIAIITAAGLLIDSLYYALTWGTLVIGSLRIPAIFERPGA